MKALAYSLAFATLFLSVACQPSSSSNDTSATDTTITVKGHIVGWDTGWVHVSTREKGNQTRQDSVRLQHGSFTYQHAANDATHYSFFKDNDNGFYLFLEPGVITINGHKDSTDQIRVTGSICYEKAKPIVASIKKRYDTYKAHFAFQDSVQKAGVLAAYRDSLNKAARAITETDMAAYQAIIKKDPDSKAAIGYFFDYYTSMDSLSTLEQAYNLFGDKAKRSMYGQAVSSMIERMRKVEIGQPAPAFTQKTPTGQLVRLADYKGKYVLLDFWASWCGPCRQENPSVVKAYQTFSNKNFTILGISLDSEKDDWVGAIKKDKLAWTHVSDLNSFNNAIAVQYVIEAIPANLLIDPNGKIIAKNLHGEQLAQKLSQLLP